MKLHDNWKFLLRRSWTVRWQAAGAVLDGLQVALPLFSDQFRPAPFAGLLSVVCIGGIVARIMRQDKDGL